MNNAMVSLLGRLLELLRGHHAVHLLSSHVRHHKRILATEHHVGVLEHLLLAILSIFLVGELLLLHHGVEHHVLHAVHHVGVRGVGVEPSSSVFLVSSLLLLGKCVLLLHLSQIVLLNDERDLRVRNFAQLIEFFSVSTVSQHFAICYHA